MSAPRPISRRPCSAASRACRLSEGVWYPRGGTGAVPRALVQLGTELGVDFRRETGVRRILTDREGRKATGIETEAGEQIRFDAVVSNADSVRTHRELLGENVPAATRFDRRRLMNRPARAWFSISASIGAYEHLLHHNFVFSHDPEEEFETIYRKGEPAADPTCYVCAPARTEPEVAPPGGEALYVLVHAPYLRPHHDWSKLFPAYRKTILDKLARCAGCRTSKAASAIEGHLTPQDIHDRYRRTERRDLWAGQSRQMVGSV